METEEQKTVPTFKATLADGTEFKNAVSVMSGLITEFALEIDVNGFRVVEMDPANVAMVVYEVKPAHFTEYNLSEKQRIGLSMKAINDVLKNAKKNDMICLERTEDNKLDISLRGNIVRKYTLPLLDVTDKREVKVPELAMKAKVFIDARVLYDQVKEAHSAGESIKFCTDNIKQQFDLSVDADLNKLNMENKGLEMTTDGLQVCKYSAEYLIKIVAAKKVSNFCTIEFSTDWPCSINYQSIDRYSLRFILAPRIESS